MSKAYCGSISFMVCLRGEDDEFSVIILFKKRDEIFPEYKYLCFLTYNNLVGMETYLHTYEFKEPIFDEKYMVQCNNLVLSFRLEGTEREILKQKVVEMTKKGEFASKISEELGISVSTVRRIRAEAQQ